MSNINIWFFLSGMLSFVFIDIVIRRLNKWSDTIEQKHAKKLIAKCGFTALLYMPSAGIDEPDLKKALLSPAFNHHIIITRDEKIVGKVASHISAPLNLRIVASND